MEPPFTLETVATPTGSVLCTWCSSPIQEGTPAVRVKDYPSILPENLRGLYLHSTDHLRNWAQQASLNAMRLIATNDPTYHAHPDEIVARRDAYTALAQLAWTKR